MQPRVQSRLDDFSSGRPFACLGKRFLEGGKTFQTSDPYSPKQLRLGKVKACV
jgi:hypothetical protein